MYSRVSALRSVRYPFAGLGCPCSAPAPIAGLGQDAASAVGGFAAGAALTAAGGVGLIAGYFIGKHAARRGLAPNRRRHRRRR